MSTRMIGGVIMTHGDDAGLRLPPRMASVQVPRWRESLLPLPCMLMARHNMSLLSCQVLREITRLSLLLYRPVAAADSLAGLQSVCLERLGSLSMAISRMLKQRVPVSVNNTRATAAARRWSSFPLSRR